MLTSSADAGHAQLPAPPPPSGAVYTDKQAVQDTVKQYYGETLQTSEDLKTSACCTAGPPPPAVRAALAKVPDEASGSHRQCRP